MEKREVTNRWGPLALRVTMRVVVVKKGSRERCAAELELLERRGPRKCTVIKLTAY
jgi:hypothetical protein